jgi:hypothetical protein
MSYTRTHVRWASGPAGGTLIRAMDLNHIEDGIEDNANDIDQMKLTIADQQTALTDLAGQVAILKDRLDKLPQQ